LPFEWGLPLEPSLKVLVLCHQLCHHAAMRKRSRVAIATILVLVLGVIAWLALRRDAEDPVYKGKRLSMWLEGYDSPLTNIVRMEEANAAVRYVGTDAIPILLRRLRAKDAPLKDSLIKLAQKQHVIKFFHKPALTQHEEAEWGFVALGLDGRSAVPALIELYAQNKSDPILRSMLSGALGAIGVNAREAIPALVQGLTDSNTYVCAYAASALGQIHCEPQLVVPALINCLTNRDWHTKELTMGALATFGANAKSAIPALTQLKDDSDARVKEAAKDALFQIDAEAASRAAGK